MLCLTVHSGSARIWWNSGWISEGEMWISSPRAPDVRTIEAFQVADMLALQGGRVNLLLSSLSDQAYLQLLVTRQSSAGSSVNDNSRSTLPLMVMAQVLRLLDGSDTAFRVLPTGRKKC